MINRHRFHRTFFLAMALSNPVVAVERTPQGSTSFLELHAQTWSLDTAPESKGSVSGTNAYLQYEWPSFNQRAFFAYENDPIVFRNWELEHPDIRRWRLNTNSVSLLLGTATGRDLERTDFATSARSFEIDNNTRYVGLETRYWITSSFFADLGVVGSFDTFNGREDTFIHERSYNVLSGDIGWDSGGLFLNTANEVTIGPPSGTGVFDQPSEFSNGVYSLGNVGSVDVFLPNGSGITLSIVNAGLVDVSAPNGTGYTVLSNNTNAIEISAPNGVSLTSVVRNAASLEINAPNGTGSTTVAVNVGDIEIDAPNGTGLTALVARSGDVSIDAANATRVRVEVQRSGNLDISATNGSIEAASELSGSTTTEPAGIVSGSVSDDFETEVDRATSELSELDEGAGTVVNVELPICSLFASRSLRQVRLSAGSQAALDGCIEQFSSSSDTLGFTASERQETRFFDEDTDQISGKARLGYRGGNLFLGRLTQRAVESLSSGLTFETSPQGNGIGRAGSWVDVAYGAGIQLHARPRKNQNLDDGIANKSKTIFTNPFPRMIEIRGRYVREVTDFETSWYEGGVSLHGSFGLVNPDSASKIRHYSIGFDIVDFSSSPNAAQASDFRLDHRQQGFSVGFFSVDLIEFRNTTLQASYTTSKVEFEGVKSNRQHRFGLTWRGNF